MRPARPLPPATEVGVKKLGDGEVKKKGKRVKDPESRARMHDSVGKCVSEGQLFGYKRAVRCKRTAECSG
jgi:hypothetical protein